MIHARWPMHIAVAVAVSAPQAAIQTNNVLYVQAIVTQSSLHLTMFQR